MLAMPGSSQTNKPSSMQARGVRAPPERYARGLSS
jgi:hypothetical protein